MLVAGREDRLVDLRGRLDQVPEGGVRRAPAVLAVNRAAVGCRRIDGVVDEDLLRLGVDSVEDGGIPAL
jgi:hypothetical protein